MPPIKLHTDSPINAAKASAITPQTAQPSDEYPPTPTRVHATSITTVTSLNTDSPRPYPAARPGQAAFPGPTSTPQRYAPPPSATTTTPATYDGPPPPQPQAFPRPLSPYAPSQSSTLPPPPRAGDTPSKQSTSPPKSPLPSRAYPVTQPPPQFNFPPPTSNLAPTSSTMTSPISPSTSRPTSLPFGHTPPTQHSRQNSSGTNSYAPPSTYSPLSPSDNNQNYNVIPSIQTSGAPDLNHPSGYQQDPRAADMTAAQRAALELDEAAANPVTGVLSSLRRGSQAAVGGLFEAGENASTGGNGGVLGGLGKGVDAGEAWNGARRLFGSVVEKVGEVESTVWKKVNGRE